MNEYMISSANWFCVRCKQTSQYYDDWCSCPSHVYCVSATSDCNRKESNTWDVFTIGTSAESVWREICSALRQSVLL